MVRATGPATGIDPRAKRRQAPGCRASSSRASRTIRRTSVSTVSFRTSCVASLPDPLPGLCASRYFRKLKRRPVLYWPFLAVDGLNLCVESARANRLQPNPTCQRCASDLHAAERPGPLVARALTSSGCTSVAGDPARRADAATACLWRRCVPRLCERPSTRRRILGQTLGDQRRHAFRHVSARRRRAAAGRAGSGVAGTRATRQRQRCRRPCRLTPGVPMGLQLHKLSRVVFGKC